MPRDLCGPGDVRGPAVDPARRTHSVTAASHAVRGDFRWVRARRVRAGVRAGVRACAQGAAVGVCTTSVPALSVRRVKLRA